MKSQKAFKKGNLIYSFEAESKEAAENKISENIYYNSNTSLVMYKLSRGVQWFFLVCKGDIKRDKIVMHKEGSNRFQLRYF